LSRVVGGVRVQGSTSSFDLDGQREAKLSFASFSGNFTGCAPRL
jgi:hypothetical protein